MPLEPTKHVNGRMWQPGQSGNPNGRPVGSRSVFSQAFCRDLAEVWSDEGREAMLKTARSNPTVFFATCARLIGPEVKLTIEQSLPAGLSADDWLSHARDRGGREARRSGCCFETGRRSSELCGQCADAT